jgi:hypothetical protein
LSNKPKTISGIITIFVTAPIWYYLLYQVLVRVHASELMFFLFWVYLPVGIFASLLAKIGGGDDD